MTNDILAGFIVMFATAITMFIGGGIILIFMYILENIFPDPLHKCKVYKKEGCCHIDNYLCYIENCSIREKYIKGKNKK